MNPHRHLRADGGEIDEALDPSAFDHAVLAGCDIERGLQRRQARHHRFGAVGDLFRRGSRLRAEPDQFVHGLLARIEHHELVLRLDQTPGHGKAHLAQADKSDVHDAGPQPLSSSANNSRAMRKLSTAAGMPA